MSASDEQQLSTVANMYDFFCLFTSPSLPLFLPFNITCLRSWHSSPLNIAHSLLIYFQNNRYGVGSERAAQGRGQIQFYSKTGCAARGHYSLGTLQYANKFTQSYWYLKRRGGEGAMAKEREQNGQSTHTLSFSSFFDTRKGHRSAISKQQEATCFGRDGMGDANDDFRVEILGGDTTWAVNSHIR